MSKSGKAKSRESIEDDDGLNTYLVIGGEGFLGNQILCDLHARYGDKARLYSSSRTKRFDSPHWTWMWCDLTSTASLGDVLAQTGAKTVFMTAASHFESNKADAFAINVDGTKAALEACRKAGVRRFIMTSSTVVIFSGKDVVNATEDTPYIKDEEHRSYYSLSKAISERIVMEANGKDGVFITVIRASAFVGPGDMFVLPNAIGILKNGTAAVQIGNNTNLCEFDHVRSISLGHVLACEKLLDPLDPSKPGPAAGEIFHITGGKDQCIALFTWLRKVWKEYNGYESSFIIVIPYSLGMVLAYINEWYSGILGRRPDGIHKNSIVYATATRYHSCEKAKRLLGYVPVMTTEEALKDAVRAYKANLATQKPKAQAWRVPIPLNWMLAFSVLLVAVVVVLYGWRG